VNRYYARPRHSILAKAGPRPDGAGLFVGGAFQPREPHPHRTRGWKAPPTKNCRLGHWLGKPIRWDPASEQILGHPDAALWLDRPQREPWML
jgi:hypothetical protein